MNVVKLAQAKNVRRFKLLFVAAVLVISGGVFAFSGAPEAIRAANIIYSCKDSDGGKNPDVFGTLQLKNTITNVTKRIDDSCAGANIVFEGYCDPKNSKRYVQTQMKCSNGTCQRGRCVPNKPTSPSATSSITFVKDAASVAKVVLPGAQAVTLGSYTVDVSGSEFIPGEIGLSFVANNQNALTGNFTVKINGITVVASAASTISNSGTQLTTLSLATQPPLRVGRNTIIVEGNVASLAQNGTVLTTYLDLSKVRRNATGQSFYDPGFTPVASDSVTIQGGALSVSVDGPSDSQTVVGTTNVVLATIRLNTTQSTSGEDVKVSSLLIADMLSNGGSYSDIGNLRLYDEAGQPLATSNSSASNNAGGNRLNLMTAIIVPKTGERVLTLKGDILGGSGSHRFTISSPADITAVGRDTGTTVVPTLTAPSTGITLTIASSGGITVTPDNDSNNTPISHRIVYAGNSDVPVFSFRIRAGTEAIKIRSLRISVTGTVSQYDLSNIRLYRNSEANPMASAQQLVKSSTSPDVYYFTWTATDNLLADTIQPNSEVTIRVKANIGGGGQAVLGDSFRFGILNSSHISAVGVSSASVQSVNGVPVRANGLTHIAPFNVMVSADAPLSYSTIVQAVLAGTQLARVKIQNNGNSKVAISFMNFADYGMHQGQVNYSLKYSDQNSTNYTANTAIASSGNTYYTLEELGKQFEIDGGAYRFVTISVASLTGSQTGDSWQFGMPNLGMVQFTAKEVDLGYDADLSGTLSGSTKPIMAESNLQLGTVVKQ